VHTAFVSRAVVRPQAGFGVPPHAVTTRNLGAAYPLVAEAGLGHRGVLIGHDLLGGSFVYDPFELYRAGLVSNPNMIVFGQIGRGKSALLKSYLWRQAVFGRRAWVVDPKGEYSGLAQMWGVRPVALRPGGVVRLNPLDPVGGRSNGAGPDDPDRRQCELLASLASACLGRGLVPRERAAVDLALASVRAASPVPTLPKVVGALLDPVEEAAALVRTDRSTLLEDGRDVALELRRLVDGDLAGMFDGETSAGLDLSGPLVVLDLSALYSSPALGVLMACATAWLQAAVSRHGGDSVQAFLVVDEAWAILANDSICKPHVRVGTWRVKSSYPRRRPWLGFTAGFRRTTPGTCWGFAAKSVTPGPFVIARAGVSPRCSSTTTCPHGRDGVAQPTNGCSGLWRMARSRLSPSTT
jgi:hypothetical protein